MIFTSTDKLDENIYTKLLSDKLDVNLGYLYENVAAQIITSHGNRLFYHTWKKDDKIHEYEVDFLISSKNKITPIEIKASKSNNHLSIDKFQEKYSSRIYRLYLFSQKDVGKKESLFYKPVYMLTFVLDELEQEAS